MTIEEYIESIKVMLQDTFETHWQYNYEITNGLLNVYLRVGLDQFAEGDPEIFYKALD